MTGMLVGMSGLSTNVAVIVNGIRRLLFPPACLFCHTDLEQRDGCCPACLDHIHIWPVHTCQHCGIILPAGITPGPCGRCMQKPPVQQQTISLYQYQDTVRDAILGWKLQGNEAAVRWLLQTASPRLQQLIDRNDLLLPVPAPLDRMRQSGQHHAANLARWVAGECGAEMEWRLLRRQGSQARQSTLSGKARRKNLRKAFTLADQHRELLQTAHAKRLWIIDDIFTTGSTVHYAALAAAKTGLPVSVLTLARTRHRGSSI
ncbi:ComF family protein [Mariprofundus erugo]|uniref:ComF family protein n=2 Tax=Mariprofundus erugo TaxID=2528639 RepID=A0A5R9GV34_9PROT|nr:ComF family protein [Mariprofundus erugo]